MSLNVPGGCSRASVSVKLASRRDLFDVVAYLDGKLPDCCDVICDNHWIFESGSAISRRRFTFCVQRFPGTGTKMTATFKWPFLRIFLFLWDHFRFMTTPWHVCWEIIPIIEFIIRRIHPARTRPLSELRKTGVVWLQTVNWRFALQCHFSYREYGNGCISLIFQRVWLFSAWAIDESTKLEAYKSIPDIDWQTDEFIFTGPDCEPDPRIIALFVDYGRDVILHRMDLFVMDRRMALNIELRYAQSDFVGMEFWWIWYGLLPGRGTMFTSRAWSRTTRPKSTIIGSIKTQPSCKQWWIAWWNRHRPVSSSKRRTSWFRGWPISFRPDWVSSTRRRSAGRGGTPRTSPSISPRGQPRRDMCHMPSFQSETKARSDVWRAWASNQLDLTTSVKPNTSISIDSASHVTVLCCQAFNKFKPVTPATAFEFKKLYQKRERGGGGREVDLATLYRLISLV